MEAGDAGLLSTGRTGSLVVVVGPSGAGKDSVLAVSRQHYSSCTDVHFVQRVITRDSNAGDEMHASVGEDEFISQSKAGAFSLTWQAHGLYYGVPAGITDRMRSGSTVILNGSRGALPEIRRLYPASHVAHLSVDPAILAARLASRGRESEAQIDQRMERQLNVSMREGHDVLISNNGELQDAVDRFIEFVQRIRHG